MCALAVCLPEVASPLPGQLRSQLLCAHPSLTSWGNGYSKADICVQPPPMVTRIVNGARAIDRVVYDFLTHWTKSRSRVTSSTKNAPGTINVLICVLLKVRTESVTSATPSAVFAGPPRIETTEHS
jgi:hypothetical protein